MKQELIKELFEKFESASHDLDGLECWSAREIQTILGYAEWRNFTNAITKASEACKASGEEVSNHFVGVNKMVELGKGYSRY